MHVYYYLLLLLLSHTDKKHLHNYTIILVNPQLFIYMVILKWVKDSISSASSFTQAIAKSDFIISIIIYLYIYIYIYIYIYYQYSLYVYQY